MKRSLPLWGLVALLCAASLLLLYAQNPVDAAQEDAPLPLLVGSVRDTQGQPVAGVTVSLWQEAEAEVLKQQHAKV